MRPFRAAGALAAAGLLIGTGTAGALEPAGAIPTAATRIEALVARLERAGDGARVSEVNRFFNQIPHRTDAEVWDQNDYWATPAEFVVRGAGDCEDYAIGKYFALRALGITDERLAITYMRDLEHGLSHMVLLHLPEDGSEPEVLDNRHPRVLPVSARRDLLPVYGFNASAVFVPGSAGRPGLPVAQRHLAWEDLLQRMQAERH